MRVFRTAKLEYAESDFDIFSGEGAKENPGRWNSKGQLTLYCTETLTVSLAEAGFYDIIYHLSILRDYVGITAKDFREVLIGRCRVLVGVEYPGIDQHLIDISSPGKFDAACKQHGVKLTFAESRRSDYTTLKNRPRRLAHAIRQTGAAGMITRSARADGRCVVIFPDQVPSSIARQTLHHTEAMLSASGSGKIWNGINSGDISASEIIATHSYDGSAVNQLVRVLELP